MDGSRRDGDGQDGRPTLEVGGVQVARMRREAALDAIEAALRDRTGLCVAFCNANTMLKALRSARYARTLRSFLVLNDGLGLDLCSYLLEGRRFAHNLNGTDFMPFVLERSRGALAVYLLGGAPGTAEGAGAWLAESYPRHRTVGCQHGYFAEDEVDEVVARIVRAKPDLLLVGMGNPKQEEFIEAWRDVLGVPVACGVGAFLDFAAGNVMRAPRAVRALRLEWLFRLAQEPRRLGRRYTLDIMLFLFAVLREAAARRWPGPAKTFRAE